jgi:hypothetical protein
MTDRYPLYSQNDEALWMLGDIYERAKQASKNEDDKNHWGDLAAKCYAKIVRDYPLSKMAPPSKERLKSMGKPEPEADPDAIVRMQKQQMYEKQHHQNVALKLPMNMIKGNPDVSTAAHSGTPQMNPPNDVVSATDILRPGAQGPSFTVAGGAAVNGNSSENGGEVVTPVDATTAPVGSNDAQTGVGVQIITPGEESTPAQPNTDAPAATTPPAANGTAPAADPAAPPNANAAPAATAQPAAPSAADSSASSSSANGANATPANGSATSSGSTQQAEQPAKAPPTDSSQESTSKKKKGLKKLVPW